MMTGLTPGTTYYVRAYAINANGLSYGEQTEFVTEMALPTVMLDEASGVTISYSVTDDGGAEVVEHGVCYGTTQSPTASGNHVSGGSGTGSFTVELTDLQPGTTYYWRLYATNSVGTVYGQEYTYTTEQEVTVPTVTTSQVTNITQTTAIGGGTVTSDGNATVTDRGICWGTSPNPTTGGSHASNGTGMGSFTVEMTGLTPSTTYYVRAYAINEVGIAYGVERSFTTLDNGAWLYYDDGTYATSVGTNDASATIYWATMFPAADLANYAGTNLTKVAVYEFASSYNTPLTVTAYLGGTTAPGTAYSTKTVTPTIDGDFDEITLDTPVAIDGTQNLWIVCSQMGTHPAQACADAGYPNNRWISLDGAQWQDLAEAGLPGYGWLLRGYVTNERGNMMELKPVTTKPIATKPHAPLNGKTIQLKSAKQ